MRLSGELIDRPKLTHAQIDRMFFLMESFYRNISRRQFDSDLQEKKWVLILKDVDEIVQGFTTMTTLETELQDRRIALVFSGDTIIHKDYWGSMEMHRVWGRFVLNMASLKNHVDYYWLLLSKGYKTYRFLSTYLYHFYPCFHEPTPVFEKQLVDWFGAYKYPDNYRKEEGVVVFDGARDYLAEGVADITPQRLKNPHVKFFVEANPGYMKGNELVCIASLSEDNVKPYARRNSIK